MKHTAILSTVSAMALFVSGGCSSTQTASAPSANTAVALTTLGPVQTARASSQPRTFRLGAGDALGQAIYDNYATIARSNAGWQYASGGKTD